MDRTAARLIAQIANMKRDTSVSAPTSEQIEDVERQLRARIDYLKTAPATHEVPALALRLASRHRTKRTTVLRRCAVQAMGAR